MSGTPREAQIVLDKLTELARQVEAYEATLHMLRLEQLRLRSELAATGYKPGDALQELL
jgi:hypothetical protein